MVFTSPSLPQNTPIIKNCLFLFLYFYPWNIAFQIDELSFQSGYIEVEAMSPGLLSIMHDASN